MTEQIDFQNVFMEEIGGIVNGNIRFASQNIKFHHGNTGNIITLDASTLSEAKWTRLANKPGIKLIFNDGKKIRFGGFSEKAFDNISKFVKDKWNVELVQEDLALKGWNYGDCKVEGQSVEFIVDGKPAFEVPLSNVSNATQNKNEAVLEFHSNDDCPIGLVEMRFHIPTTDEDMTDPVEEFYKAVMKYAGIETEVGQPVANLPEILCMTPRGRYDVKIYHTSLSLHGKTYDYKIPLKTIQRLFLLPHKDGRHMYFCCSLSPPIRQGQTRYQYLVMEFPLDEEIVLDLTLTDEQLGELKLPRKMEGASHEVVCTLFRALVGIKVITEGSFNSHSGSAAIVCAFKQTSGFLYPLEKGFLYLHKPSMFVRFDEVSNVHFARSDISTRSFDFEVETKNGQSLVFNSVEKDEYATLYDYCEKKHLRIRNAKKTEVARNTDIFDDSDSDHDPYREKVKKEGKVRDAERKANEDDESDPEDEDYDLDIDLARRRKEREENSSEGSESEPTEEFDSSGSDVVSESSFNPDEDDEEVEKRKKEKKEKKKKDKKEKKHGSGSEGEGGKKRKKRTKKDPNAPKRAQTGYMFWLNENRSDIKKDGDTVADVAKRGGELWKGMSEEDKKPWEKKAADDRLRYEREMKEYKSSGGAAKASSSKSPQKKTSSPTKSPGNKAKSKEYVESTDSSDVSDAEKSKPKKKKEHAVKKAKKDESDDDKKSSSLTDSD